MWTLQESQRISAILLTIVTITLLSFVSCEISNYEPKLIKTDYDTPLQNLIMQTSCSYERFSKRLTCNCESVETAAFLDLRLKFYNFGNQGLSSVLIKQCKELLVIIDLRGFHSNNARIIFQQIGKLEFQDMKFDQAMTRYQRLMLDFENVEEILMEEQFIEDELSINAQNVRVMTINKSQFSKVPADGFYFSNSYRLRISESTFFNIRRQSIKVEKIDEVTIVYNEMTENAVKVVEAIDGSHLIISCNHLRGVALSPECKQKRRWSQRKDTTTTTTTTTSTTTTTTAPAVVESVQDNSLNLIIVALIGVITLSAVAIVAAILCKRKQRGSEDTNSIPISNVTSKDKASPVEEEKKVAEEEEADESETFIKPESPQPVAPPPPAWLNEIQKNKIFNKQKSMLNDSMKNIRNEESVHEEESNEVKEKETLCNEEENADIVEPPEGFDETKVTFNNSSSTNDLSTKEEKEL